MSRQSSDTPHYAVYSPTSTLKHGESNMYLRKKPGDLGEKIVTIWSVSYRFAD
jgi:hypothetical protein